MCLSASKTLLSTIVHFLYFYTTTKKLRKTRNNCSILDVAKICLLCKSMILFHEHQQSPFAYSVFLPKKSVDLELAIDFTNATQ